MIPKVECNEAARSTSAQCQERTERGGFSERGANDRMHGTRYEPCGKPTTIGNACTRHANLRAKKRAALASKIADRDRSLES